MLVFCSPRQGYSNFVSSSFSFIRHICFPLSASFFICTQKRPVNPLSKIYRSLNSFSSYELSDYGLRYLFCVICYTAFADNIYFDLTRIFQLSFYLLGNISCQQYHIGIADLFRNNHNTDFPSCLNSKRLI